MPRKVKFNSARQASARKTAKNKDRGGGGKFTKVCVSPIFSKEDALNCEQNISPSPIRNDYDMDVQHQITEKSSTDNLNKPQLRAADRCLRLNCHCQEDANWEADDS